MKFINELISRAESGQRNKSSNFARMATAALRILTLYSSFGVFFIVYDVICGFCELHKEIRFEKGGKNS